MPSSRAPQPSKIQSLEEVVGHLSNTKRLTVELERFGHFTVDEGHSWTQAHIYVKWDRLNAAKEHTTPTNERSLAFVLNWDFKPAPEPEYIIVNDDPQPVPTRTVPTPTSSTKPFIPSALETPVNYWDDWRASEGIVERNLTPAQYGHELRQKKPKKSVKRRLLKYS